MNRFWLRSFVFLLSAVQLLTAANLPAADERASEKLLPKETLAFLSISNVPELVKKWDKTSIGQMLHDPQLKPFLDDVAKAKDEFSKDKVEATLGVALDDILQLPQGDVTIAFLETFARKPAFLILVEYGSHQETLDKLVKKMDETLEGFGKEQSTEEVENIKVQIYSDKDPKSKNPLKTITYFTDKSYFVLSNEVEAIKEVLTRWNGNSDDTLAQNDQYEYIQTQCKSEGSDPLVKFFLNPFGLIKSAVTAAQAAFPEIGMAAAVFPFIGIDELKGYGGAMALDDGDFESVANAFIYAENAKGLLGVFKFPAEQLTPPKWVPETIASYSIMNWDVAGAYSSIETLVDMLSPGTLARKIEELADEGLMINLKKDLIDQLDGKIHFVQSDSKEGEGEDEPAVPLMLLALGLKDSNKMKKTLATVAKAEDSNLETREFNGQTIYEVNQLGDEHIISIAVAEGVFVVTNDTPLLEGMMRGESGRANALVDSDTFKRFAKFFPSKTSMQSFQRNDAQFKAAYELLRQSEFGEFLGVDFSKLPAFDLIAGYLTPSASYVVPDKKGAKTVSFSLKRSE